LNLINKATFLVILTAYTVSSQTCNNLGDFNVFYDPTCAQGGPAVTQEVKIHYVDFVASTSFHLARRLHSQQLLNQQVQQHQKQPNQPHLKQQNQQLLEIQVYLQ